MSNDPLRKRTAKRILRPAAAVCLAVCLIMSSGAVPAAACPLNLSSLSGLAADETDDAEFSNKNWSKYYSKKDLKYLSCVIYCETEPLGYEARVALGNIVINRVNSTTDWGHVNTIKDVIYDTKWSRQFACTTPLKQLGGDSLMDRAYLLYAAVRSGETDEYQAWQINGMTGCIEAAKDVMCGKKTVPDSFVYCRGEKYFETDIATCKEKGRRYLIIEQHIYYEN